MHDSMQLNLEKRKGKKEIEEHVSLLFEVCVEVYRKVKILTTFFGSTFFPLRSRIQFFVKYLVTSSTRFG